MKDYKDTLLMPKTDFEMRGNLGQKEPKIQKQWEDLDIYNKRIKKNEGAKEYALHDGPPYANGDIHMGHAMNKCLKDFVIRYKNMNGFQARYIPGWDTHGLPIETALAKKGIKRREMDLASYRELCEEYAYEQVARQKSGFKRLGSLGEYDEPYITLQHDFERDQIKVFAQMVKKGLIFKGKKPVYWSPSSESALAEAEIEYHDRKDPSIFVKFKLVDGDGSFQDASLVVWTTTPWTIPADLAVCAGPKIDYVLVETNKGKLIFAEALKETLENELELDDVKVIERFDGNFLTKYHYVLPLFDRVCPVIVGDHVTTTDGTGLVHTAPGHGEDDFMVGKANGLEIFCPVDDKGYMMESAGEFAGLFYEDCNKAVVERLDSVGALLKLKWITHSYPHDWRTKKPVIFRATPQWFANIDPLKDDILNAIKEVEWIPKWGEVRISNMIKDRHEWCISRQRAWGVPIPVFYAENGEEIMTEETLANVAKLFGEYGSNIWFKLDAKDLLPKGFTHPGSPNGIFKKETDTMDVWFDSGSSHQVMVRHGLKYPTDLYLEGSDQYRGWFNSSLITSVALIGKAPYKKVFSHGFILDEKGQKMSKSLGNTVDPIKVCNEMGADILRLWVASVEVNADIGIGPEILKQVSESYRKIRNTIRFLMANTSDFSEENRIDYEKLDNTSKYVEILLNRFIQNIKDFYEAMDYQSIYKEVNYFVSNTLSAFYLDFTKDILYIEPLNSLARRSVQTVFYDILEALLTLLSPIIPHTTSEAYQMIPNHKEEDIYLCNMPNAKHFDGEEELVSNYDKFMEYRIVILKELENARASGIIGKSFAAKLTITPNKEFLDVLEYLNINVSQVLIVSQLEILGVEDEFKVEVTKATGHVCSRCWATVPEINEETELCHRCEEIVKAL